MVNRELRENENRRTKDCPAMLYKRYLSNKLGS